MQYNWSKYNLLDRLDELKKIKKGVSNKERILINQNIDFLKSNIEELENTPGNELSYLDRIIMATYYFDDHDFLKDDIKNFALYLTDLKVKEFEYNKISISQKELLQITHDFYKSQDKEIYNKFMESYKYRRNHLRFINESDYCGTTYSIPYFNETFIEVINTPDINMLYSLIHEYAHAIAFHFNPNSFMDYNRYFTNEIESTFFELVASDYLKKNVNVGSEYEAIYNDLFTTINNCVDLTDYLKLIELYSKNKIRTNRGLRKIAYEECDFTNLYYENLMEITPSALTPYVIGYLFAVELYELYKFDKEKALYNFKKMTLLKDLTNLEYYREIKKLGLYPNSHLNDFINDLTDKTSLR